MNFKIKHIYMLILLAFLFVETPTAFCRAVNEAGLLLKRADKCRTSLYASTKKKAYRHNWLKCSRRYKRVYTSYPKSDQAVWALYRSAGLLTGLYRYSCRSRDLDEALSLYRRVVNKHKGHRLADDAQYKIGEIFYRFKKDPAQAYLEFLKVDVKFPSGDMGPKAKKVLKELAVVLSKRNLKRGAKVGSGSRSKRALVKDIRYWSTPNYTRVVVDLQGPVKYEHHLLKADPGHKKPRRIYIDVKNARVTPRSIDSTVPIKNDLLQRARAGQHTIDTVRVVLDIEKIGGYDVFHLYDPFRIVVDVRRFEKGRTKKTRPRITAKKRKVSKGIKRAKAQDQTVSLARQLGLNVKRVVIDPGHGGKDPGCHARGFSEEKKITLSIARILAKKLRKEIGCDVYLTRKKDSFLSLERRTAIANIKKADLFISLHVNAHRNSRIHGLETYFLNMATDKRAVMVAARENATSEKNISDLQTILNDLMLNTKINESSRLAHYVQKGMLGSLGKRYKGIRSLGVKQAPFYVLIGAQMPAILVEAGFLTNRSEGKRLMNKKYQERLAEGICTGIRTYMRSIDQAYKGR